jgi:hypothetical protein
MTHQATGDVSGRFTVEGEAILFGFPPTRAVVTIKRRSFGWRAGGAARTMAAFLVITPVVLIVPPHAPWALGALGSGAILARRRWVEHFTLQSVQGTCPKCGAPLDVKSGRLKTPHPITCEACHHQSSLVVPEQALNRNA